MFRLLLFFVCSINNKPSVIDFCLTKTQQNIIDKYDAPGGSFNFSVMVAPFCDKS
jgi:hypothetical protein